MVGYVEPHPRPETAALLEGLELIPTRKVNYKGKTFVELDIDAVIERNPEIVLIDELAHSNVPTMRHLKRFGDVEELLAKGIHVYTTVNIQHIESLHDLVEEITGVKVRERIPDYLIDHAAQIKLVDIEPDDLIQRLKEGKIYHLKQAEKAMDFFSENRIWWRFAKSHCAELQTQFIINRHKKRLFQPKCSCRGAYIGRHQ